MKTFVKIVAIALFTMALSVGVFAQEEKTALYEKITNNYQGDSCAGDDISCLTGSIAKKQIAVKAGKEYMQKYGSDAGDQVAAWLKDAIPAIEKSIDADQKAISAEKVRQAKQARYSKFNSAMESKNWDGAYQFGGEILAHEPNMLDVILVLGSIGLDEVGKTPPVDKYNDATIKYAQMAIQKMKSGVSSQKYGAYAYEYKKKDEAMAWMNYTVGMIMYHRQGRTDAMKKKQALNYLYEATRYNSDRKQEPRIYGMIGDAYFNKAIALGQARNKLDKTVPANIKAIDDSVALEKAYAERALGAYAVAYKYAKANPKEPMAYKNSLLKIIKDLFNFRYQKPAEKTTLVINNFINSAMPSKLPHPATAVKPVAKPVEMVDKTTEAASNN